MKHLAIAAAFWLLAAACPVAAQITVAAQTQRSNFLLYERVDLLVTVTNIGESDIVLNNDEGHPWLSFLLSRHVQQNYMPIRQERQSNFSPSTLKAGESKIFRVNITPLFTFREEGDYRVEAVVDLPGQGQIASPDVPFSVLKGQTVWKQVHPADGSERTYSLIRFSPDSDSTELYLRVEDPAENIVYTNIGLGQMASFIKPDAFFDPQGNLHILHPAALATYVYTRTDPSGKIVHQGIFKTSSVQTITGIQRVPPQLHKLDDGNVIVMGGVEQDPHTSREKLSDGQSTRHVSASPQPMPSSPAANTAKQ